MKPNKKTLSSKSNNSNSPWLLCPSKSFPGKFYYFNGSTGETAWSLNDSDHNHFKKDIHRVEDNGHVYPEPFGPPGDESTNTSSASLKKDFPSNPSFNNTTNFTNRMNFNNLSNATNGLKFSNPINFGNRAFKMGSNLNGSRIFGNFNKTPMNFPLSTPSWEQAVLPTYEDRLIPPKVVWTLTPMLVNEQPFQIYDPTTQYDSDMFIHNPGTQSSFHTFSRPQTNPFFKVNSSTARGVQTGTPLYQTKFRYDSKDVQTMDEEPLTREEACQTFGSEMEVPIETKKDLSKPVLQPSKFNAKPIGNSTLSPVNAAANVANIDDNSNSMSLKENDLRFLLEAKRRKSVDSGEGQKSIKDMPISQSGESTPKKRVTFNLGDQEYLDMPKKSTDLLSALCSPVKPVQIYVVPDSDVLIANYEYIENNVLSVENCRLLVPFAVKAAIEAAGRGECRGRHDVVSARHALRKLTAPNIIIQREPENCSSNEEDGIVDCCWKYSQDDCSLTLLTSNKELIKKAENIGISCSVFDPVSKQIAPTVTDHNINNKASEENNELKSRLEIDLDISSLGISKLDIRDSVNQNDNLCKKQKELKTFDIRDESKNQANLSKKHDKEVRTESSKNNIKVSGITKLSTVFNMDEELARYYVKNEVMDHRLASRSDEWTSRLILAMEGTLFDVLVKENVKKNMPPKDLYELVRKIGDTFKKHVKIRTIVDRLVLHLQHQSNVSKFRNIKPVDFVRLLGFCMVLIQNLKEILDYVELDDADDLLSELVKHIEHPDTDVELSLEKLATPERSGVESENKIPLGYTKKQSNVLEYLKKHYPGAFVSKNEESVPKIVRTVGKDLNAVKVFNTKDVIDSTENVTRIVEPEIVKKFKVIEAFEEKLKKQFEVDYEYQESLSTLLSEHSSTLDGKAYANECSNKMNKLNSSADATDDLSSELVTECIYAYPIMKAFLAELKTTFKMIYNLVSDTMQDAQEPEMERSDLDFKINMAYNYIIEIGDKLKSILARETGSGPTVKMLLIRAGDYVEEDKTMSEYIDLITKYLKQAKTLEQALELLLNIRGDCQLGSSNVDSVFMS